MNDGFLSVLFGFFIGIAATLMAIVIFTDRPEDVRNNVLDSSARFICVQKIKDPSMLGICVAHQTGMLREYHKGPE